MEMNYYQKIAVDHAGNGARFDLLNHLGSGLPLLNVTQTQVHSYWLVIKQQYNAAAQTFKSFPVYEQKIKRSLEEKGEILFEDDYALVFYGDLPEFSLGRKVEASMLLVA